MFRRVAVERRTYAEPDAHYQQEKGRIRLLNTIEGSVVRDPTMSFAVLLKSRTLESAVIAG